MAQIPSIIGNFFTRKRYWAFVGILPILFCQIGYAGWLEAVNPPLLPANVELNDLNNTRHALFESKGKVVLVNFWASWCPPCLEEMPSLIRLVESMALEDLLVLAVNVNEKRNRVARIASKLGFNFPVLLDHSKSVAKDWNIKVYPSSYLIDKQGFVRFRAIGPVEWDSEESVTQVKRLLAEAYP